MQIDKKREPWTLLAFFIAASFSSETMMITRAKYCRCGGCWACIKKTNKWPIIFILFFKMLTQFFNHNAIKKCNINTNTIKSKCDLSLHNSIWKIPSYWFNLWAKLCPTSSIVSAQLHKLGYWGPLKCTSARLDDLTPDQCTTHTPGGSWLERQLGETSQVAQATAGKPQAKVLTWCD